MARKPIELERVGMLTPRERLWAAARKLRRFTLKELQDATVPAVRWFTCKTYLESLVRAKILVPDGEKATSKSPVAFPATIYRIGKDSLDAPRVTTKGGPVTQGNGNLAMWRAMHALKVFDWHDVKRAASLPGFVVSDGTAKRYISHLAQAGYFQLVQESEPGTAARFRLVKKTGAQPPAVTKRRVVFDRNTGDFMWQESAQEVVDGIDE